MNINDLQGFFNSGKGTKNVIKKSITYIISDVVNKVLPFLLLPIITRYLTPTDYGTLSVFTSIAGFLAVFVGLGSQEMVRVNFFRLQRHELRLYIGNVIYICFITSIFYLGILFFLRELFFKEYGLGFIWLAFAVLYTFGGFISKLISIIWISEGRSLAFAKYQNSSTIFIVATTILFVVVFNLNWQGRIYSLLLSSSIFAFIAFYLLKKKDYIQFSLSKKGLWACAKESIGVLPYSVSFWFKNSALLLIMAAFIGKDETGLYSSAWRIAMIIHIATVSINRVWQPLLFKLLSRKEITPDLDLKIVKNTYAYILILILVGLSVFLLSKLLVKLALAPSYYDSVEYVQLLAVAITLQSLFTAFADFLMFYKKTSNLTQVSISGIILQYFIMGIFYTLGELTVSKIILSTIIAGIFTFLYTWSLTSRIRKLPWVFFLKKH